MKYTLSLLFLWALCLTGLSGQNLSPEVTRMKQYCEMKAARYLVKGDSLADFFRISDEGIRFYPSSAARKKEQPEFALFWNELESWKSLQAQLPEDSLILLYKQKGIQKWDETFRDNIPPALPAYLPADNRTKPLLGMKIALDPGHVGGKAEVAFWEKKMVKIRKQELGNFPADVLFNEGNLTLGTALILKEKLEAAGATVMMTRSRPGETAFGITYEEWLTQKFPDAFEQYRKEKNLSQAETDWWMSKATPEDKFQKLFRHLDLKERARKINAWKPDFTVFIHYNVKESNRMDDSAYVHAVTDNFNMGFIPGAFLNHELDSLENRVHFLRLLLTNDIEQSQSLTSCVVREMARFTKVPVVPPVMDDSLNYLGKSSIRTETPGVYCRNLALNERVAGPICFGESLYQDNRDECIRLFSIDYNVNGFRVSPRTREVAEAYYQGILSYLTGRRN